ncbi:MAG: MMPL family transporter [bacterium]|nr:MMPL family transporter [bacterium]
MFEWQARAVRRAPKLVLAGVAAATVGLLAGFLVQDVPPAPVDATATFLPADSELAEASAAIRESFPEAAGVEIVQVLARGDVLAADSLRAVRDLQARIIEDPAIAPYVVTEPLAGYVGIVESVLAAGGLDLATVSDAELDAALDRLSRSPELAAARAALDHFVPRDAAGTPIAGLSLITLNDAGDPLGLQDAQLRAGDIAASASAELDPLAVSVISRANSNVEGKEARESSLFVLMGIALVVMVVLLAVFYRSWSDVVLAIVGLLLTILWTFGAQAWLSPGGAGVVDPENILIVLAPVLLIGLSVDYALQITGRYREALVAGGDAVEDDSS